MGKTYFIRSLNLHIRLALYLAPMLLSSLMVKLFVVTFKNRLAIKANDLTNQCFNFLDKVANTLDHIGLILLTMLMISIGIELLLRLIKDSVLNSFKSVWQTFRFRRFLIQSDNFDKVNGDSDINSSNSILKSFNKAVAKCVIDVKNDKIIVFIKVPRKQQAQKLLKGIEGDIKEELTSRNPNYYFSASNRKYGQLWFVGTRRS